MDKVYPRAEIYKSPIDGDRRPWKLYFTVGLNKPQLKFWYGYSTFDQALSEANRRVRLARRFRTSQ